MKGFNLKYKTLKDWKKFMNIQPKKRRSVVKSDLFISHDFYEIESTNK